MTKQACLDMRVVALWHGTAYSGILASLHAAATRVPACRYLGIIMEYVPGDNLQNFLRSSGGRVAEPLARFIFQQLLLALDFCHRRGKVNRWAQPDLQHCPAACTQACLHGLITQAAAAMPASACHAIWASRLLLSVRTTDDGRLAEHHVAGTWGTQSHVTRLQRPIH
jgi:hypothetical protein